MVQQTKPRALAKSERVEARVSPEQKQIIQYAANLLGLSLSDFLITSAQSAAQTVIEERRKIRLTMQESIAFAEAVLNPREPNDALKEAFADYRREIISG